MEQKFIKIANIQLSYLDKNEDKEMIIFFIHGNSMSSRSWNAQFNSHLLQNYRLIAIDLPAHGDSEASANPNADYSIPGLGAIIASMVKALAGTNPYLMVGLSLGTNILAESLAFELKPIGIVLAGSCLVAENYPLEVLVYPDTNVHVVFMEQSRLEDLKIYADQVMTNRNNIVVDEFIADYYRVKLAFRPYLLTSIQAGRYNDQIKLLAATNTPLLLIFGKNEQIIKPNYLDDAGLNLWGARIYKIPGASHLVQLDQPELFNQLLADYTKSLSLL